MDDLQPEFLPKPSRIDFGFCLFTVILYLWDVTSDFFVAFDYMRGGWWSYFTLTLSFLLLPALLTTIWEYIGWLSSQPNPHKFSWTTIFHVFLEVGKSLIQLPASSAHFHHVMYTFVAYYELKWRRLKQYWHSPNDKEYVRKIYNLISQLGVFALIEGFAEAIPQLMLQIYILYHEYGNVHGPTGGEVSRFRMCSIVASIMSCSWSTCIAYKGYLSGSPLVQNGITSFPGLILLCLANMLIIGSRVISFVLLLIVSPSSFFIVAVMHCSFMFMWAVDPNFSFPDIYCYQTEYGEDLYAMVYKPFDFDPKKRYPTILNVYGGPEVQLVYNSFRGVGQLWLYLLASQGYCVVSVDSRGSHHRGVQFESHIRRRMGTVELNDQVEVLEWLAKEQKFIDLNRVGIYGWSYGGYLSLMGLIHYPKLFKVCVAGAPVTSWELYDSGYTERYMDLPQNNRVGYKEGSVLTYAHQFPDEVGRLLIVHGMSDENVHFVHTAELLNALVRWGKPYQLQLYPSERHSLRRLDASEHYETVLLSFLQQQLL